MIVLNHNLNFHVFLVIPRIVLCAVVVDHVGSTNLSNFSGIYPVRLDILDDLVMCALSHVFRKSEQSEQSEAPG